MRSFRLCIVSALTFAASILLLHAPSYAAVLPDPGYGLRIERHIEITIDVATAVQAVVVEKSDLAFVADIERSSIRPVMVMSAEPLKPESAESYQTHGLVFLKHRMRC